MNLLLDTHCLIWALCDAPELDAQARNAISTADTVWFSEASLWEIGLKWRQGKINLAPRRILDQALYDRFRALPIDLDALLLSSELQQNHADPFDRLLYAQAICSKMNLLTIDRELPGFGAKIWSA